MKTQENKYFNLGYKRAINEVIDFIDTEIEDEKKSKVQITLAGIKSVLKEKLREMK